MIKSLTTDSALKCNEECSASIACTAFSFEKGVGLTSNCNLYHKGPYTYGNGRENTRCYIMPGRMHFICYIVTNIIAS